MFSARSRFLICVSALSLSMALPAFAQVKKAPLWEPVVDFTYKGGNNRHYGTASVMLPFAQNRDSLLFADIRTTISDQDTFEGNAGLGFRKIAGDDAIFGVYGFFDARESEYDNKFQQVTLGAEMIGEHFEARGNVYVPFGKEQKLAYDNGASAFISGSNIMIQDGRVYESSLQGFDVEIGHSFPVLDNARGYLGYYSFHNDGVSDVSGYRARVEADVGDWLSFGIEKQFSNTEQDDSVFGEVRLRVPFDGWSKGSTRRKAMSPLQQRMMVPIVRDIDIVTNALPAAEPVVVLGADGKAPSKVYFVDNTAAAGGDGSVDNPFNTLAAAEAVAGNYDTIYVAAGDGTTTGYDAGVTLDNQGQRLIGSGVALTLDTAQIQVPNGAEFSNALQNLTLKPAQSTTPTITNAAGSGITITGDDTTISGLTVDGATDDNVYIHNADNVTVEYITSTNATDDGIYALYDDGGTYTGYIRDNVIQENGDLGIYIYNKDYSTLDSVVSDNIITGNTDDGMYVYNYNYSTLDSVVSNNTITNNNDFGIYFYNQGHSVSNSIVSDNIITGNNDDGLCVNNYDYSILDSVVSDNIISDNTDFGIYVYNYDYSILDNVVSDNIISNNADDGINIYNRTYSTLDSVVSNNTITNNNDFGIYIFNYNHNTANSVVSDNIISDNADDGIYVYNYSYSTLDSVVSGNTISNNNDYGVYLYNYSYSTLDSVVSGNTITNNADDGLYFITTAYGTIDNIVNNNIISNNGDYGFYALALNNSTLDSVVSNNIISNNDDYGIYIYSNNNSTLDSVVNDNTVSNNDADGINLFSYNNSTLDSVVSGNTVTDNNGYGVYLNDDSALAMTVDLGGGTLGSTGQNLIYNNTNQEVFVDLDGNELKAENNWWGDASGLQPAETGLDNGTIDADPYLTEAP